MIDSSQYNQDSERYQNNISPEPSKNSDLSFSQCFKTPVYQHVNTILHAQHPGQPIHSFYPTPPSDNEETSSHLLRLNVESTPKLNDNFHYSNFQNKNFYSINQQPPVHKVLSPEDSNCSSSSHESSTISPQQDSSQKNNSNSSRYKRRSRTTYTKYQLDILEATFQKTHYPEIRMVDELSSMLHLSTERISIWFQNRRARFKKSRKLESNQPETALNPVYKAVESSYSPACASSLSLTSPNILLEPNNLYPATFDTSLQQFSSNDKNPQKLINSQLVAEKLNINKYLPPINETRNLPSTIQLTSSSTVPFYPINQYPVIPNPNEQGYYNLSNYNFTNQSTPNINFQHHNHHNHQITPAHNVNYHDQNRETKAQ